MVNLTNEEKAAVANAMKRIQSYIETEIVPRVTDTVDVEINDKLILRVCKDGNIEVQRNRMNEFIKFRAVYYAPVATLIVLNWHDIKARLNTELQERERIHREIMNFEI